MKQDEQPNLAGTRNATQHGPHILRLRRLWSHHQQPAMGTTAMGATAMGTRRRTQQAAKHVERKGMERDYHPDLHRQGCAAARGIIHYNVFCKFVS